MAKVLMKRIEIIALLTESKSVVERLQRRGVVDLFQQETTAIGMILKQWKPLKA